MLEPVDIEGLRRRAAWALEEVQKLPGFAEKLAAVGEPPASARDWPWDAVVKATESDSWRPGAIRWEDRPADEANARILVGEGDAELPSVGDGMVRVPVDENLPEPADRDALSAYRVRVVEFAKWCVLDAEWSARAVHDAIRFERPVRLPGRPEPMISPPLDEPLMLDRRQPLPRDLLVEVGTTLLAAAAESVSREYRPSGSPPGDRVWLGAIEAVRLHLTGESLPSKQRSRRSRLKPWLNHAVSGVGGAALHQVDARDYPDARRERARAKTGTTVSAGQGTEGRPGRRGGRRQGGER